MSTCHHQVFQDYTVSHFQRAYLLLGDNSKCSKGLLSWKSLFSIDRETEFGIMPAANGSDSSDIDKSLDTVADIVVRIIIFVSNK
jgi:hypothetical protein